MTAAGSILAVFALLLFVPSAVQRVRHRRTRRKLRAEVLEALRWDLAESRMAATFWEERSGAWEEECRRVTTHAVSLIEVIDDHQAAAAAEAMHQNPAYFSTAAGRALAELDERTWGKS